MRNTANNPGFLTVGVIFYVTVINLAAYLFLLIFGYWSLSTFAIVGSLYVLLSLIPVYIRQFRDLKQKRVRSDNIWLEVVIFTPALIILDNILVYSWEGEITLRLGYLVTAVAFAFYWLLTVLNIQVWIKALFIGLAYSGWAYFSLAVTQTSPYIYSCFYFLFSSLALFCTTLDIKTIATHQYLHDYPVITGKIRLSLYIYFFNLFTSSLFGLLGVWMEWLGNHLSRLGEIHSLEQVIERSTEQPVTIKRSMEFDTDDAIGEK